MLKIRKTTYDDLKDCDRIYAHAKEMMRINGNPTQWNGEYPNSKDVIEDIKNDCSYVVTNDDKVVAVLAFIEGIEPTYSYIEDGAWLQDAPYATIHRIASDNTVKGILNFVVDYFSKKDLDIRIDTHEDNKIMLHQIQKCGFKYCGIIYVHDHSKRLAFQLCKKY